MPDLAVTFAAEAVDIAARLLAANSSNARAKLLADGVVGLIPDSACVVYRFDPDLLDTAWKVIGRAGEVSVGTASLSADSSLLQPMVNAAREAIIYSAIELQREHYAHLQVTRSLASISYLPLTQRETEGERLIGAIEVLSFSKPLSPADVEALEPLVRIAGPSVMGAQVFEQEKENLLDSVHRMTQLYDLEKSLNSTLDLDRVMALIPRKVQPMLQCQAVHLWLFNGDTLTVMATAGTDPTVEIGTTQKANEGYVAAMAEEGVPVTITDAEDERLLQRSGDSGARIWTAMIVPLMDDEAEVGVLEAVNKTNGASFDDDDEFFFSSIAETVGSALKNASLMLAERKLEILEALVHVSSEITSTLRLDRLLQIIVNSPQSVLPFERCAIALDNRGKLQLKSISGMSSVPLGDAQVDHLQGLLRWLSTQQEPLHHRQREDEAGEDLPAAVARHFASTGYRALYALPLSDDQGRVGVLIYEAGDPDFLDQAHTEMIKILAGQATVAIRNALLYREVPLISLLEPLMQRKQALLRTSRGRQIGFAVGAAAATLFLVFCPWPMRVTGEATVAAQHTVTVAAPVDGNVTAVFAREGQRVAAGQVLASMNDLQWQMDLSSAEARYRSALLTMQADLARGAAQAGADRAQAEYLRAEADRARARIESAQLKSPITGVVMTPSLQNEAGEHLEAGAAFAQVLDLSSAVVDIAIPQSDASLLAPNQTAAIKLDSYPQRSWHGNVAVVSPQAQIGDGIRTFAARVPFPNEDAVLRAGMTGRAKIFIGYRPAGYVLLRRPALWLWQTLWNWFGW
jgi:RND family efflux transporter MFP subunit